jgi:hypothetical protein
MALLVDVDALAKSAHWQLLPEIPECLAVPLAECATLTSARFRAQRALTKPDGKPFHNVEAAQAALDAIAKMLPAVAPDGACLPYLQKVAGIDAGEAVLLSSIANSDTRLLTGDKRALKALANLQPDQRAPFEGRIILIEQLIQQALKRHGLPWLRERICPHLQIDNAMANIMGSRCDAGLESVQEGLASYIGEIERSASPSLIARL